MLREARPAGGARRFAASADGDFPASKDKMAVVSSGRTRPLGRYRSVDSYMGYKHMNASQPTQTDVYNLIQSTEGTTAGKSLSPYRPLPAIGDRIPTPIPPPVAEATARASPFRAAPPRPRTRLRPPSPSPPPTPPRRHRFGRLQPTVPARAGDVTGGAAAVGEADSTPAHLRRTRSSSASESATPQLLRERTYNVLQPRVLRRAGSDSEASSSSSAPSAAGAGAGAGRGAAAQDPPSRRKKRSRRRAAPPPPPKRHPDGLDNTLLFGPRLNHTAPRRLATHYEAEDATPANVASNVSSTTSTGLFSSELSSERRGGVAVKWFN